MRDMEVLQIPSELEQLVALYEATRPARVLEIGCWDGGTLREWLTRAVEGAAVVAVDLEHRNEQAYAEWVRDDVTLHTLTADSRSVQAAGFIAENGPYDWVFIDGDHSDAGVRSDVASCIGHMPPGAVLVLHDIVAEHGWQGDGISTTYPPGRVLEEFKAAGHRTAEFVDPGTFPWARGIGVIWL